VTGAGVGGIGGIGGTPHVAGAGGRPNGGASGAAVPTAGSPDAIGAGGVGGTGGVPTSPGHATLNGGCLADSWCWSAPLPAKNLTAVWANGEEDVWVVGKAGQALHWDGSGWAVKPSDTAMDLEAVWSATWNDTWACGPDGIHHFDGTAWAHALSGKVVHALWGSSAADVWAGGDDGVWHWDGNSWSISNTTPAIISISGTSASNVWALGGADQLVHRDLRHWDGASWSSVQVPPPNATLLAVWTGGPDELWLVGTTHYGYEYATHWNGQVWTEAQRGDFGSLTAVWGGPKGVWALASNYRTVALAGDGNGAGSTAGFGGGSGVNPAYLAGDVWLIYPGGLRYFHDGAWTPSKLPTPPTISPYFKTAPSFAAQGLAIWGSSADDVWVDTSRWDGSTWHDGELTALGPIWGLTRNDVWLGLLGDPSGTVYHWRGNHIDGLDSFQDIASASIWGSGSNDVWILGFGPSLTHWNGSAMSTSALPWDTSNTQPYMDQVWGTASDDVWAVGEQVFHFNGQAWSAVAAGTSARFRGIWGATSNDLWATTDAGLMHWNGTSWQADQSVDNSHLSAVWGFASNDIWAGGARDDGTGHAGAGLLLHWNGSAWQVSVESARLPPIGKLWGASATEVWATVDGGVLRRTQP